MDKIIEAPRLLTEERSKRNDDRATTIKKALAVVGTFNYDPDRGVTFERWLA